MSENKRRRRRGGIAVLVGLIACSTVVWNSSHAAFSSTAPNTGNQIGAGSVTIRNSTASAIFSSSDAVLAPGNSRTVCIGVRYTGTLASPTIKVYFENVKERNTDAGSFVNWADDTTSMMDDSSTMQIQVNNADLGTTDPGTTCTGTYADVAAATNMRTLIKTNTNFTTNTLSTATAWPTVTAGQWRSFKFIYTLNSGAVDAAQGDAVQFDIVWEAQN